MQATEKARIVTYVAATGLLCVSSYSNKRP